MLRYYIAVTFAFTAIALHTENLHAQLILNVDDTSELIYFSGSTAFGTPQIDNVIWQLGSSTPGAQIGSLESILAATSAIGPTPNGVTVVLGDADIRVVIPIFGVDDQFFSGTGAGNTISYSGVSEIASEFIEAQIGNSIPLEFGVGFGNIEIRRSSSGEPLAGDVNLDGVVDFSDIPAFITVLSVGGFQAEADTNQDGTVDFSDIPAFIDILISQ